MILPLRIENFGCGAALDGRDFDRSLLDVESRPGDATLVAVGDGDRHSQAEGPGCGALQAEGSVILEGVGLVEDVSVAETVGEGELDVGGGAFGAETGGGEVGTGVRGDLDELVEGRRGWRGVAELAADFEVLRLRWREIEEEAERAFCSVGELDGIEPAELGGVDQGLDAADVGTREVGLLEEGFVDGEQFLEAGLAGGGETRGFASGEDVDIDGVEVVDLNSDSILVAGFLET